MKSFDSSSPIASVGVVTFLDVLGWKGIWQRKQNAIGDLESLVNSMNKMATKLSRGRKISKDEIISPETRVMIISDTIVIFTEATIENVKNIIDMHGSLCQEAIPSSIKKGIPIRGATSYGEVIISTNNSIYAGKAIDEAASWHEVADWIGVFLTPTANFVYEANENSIWVENNPPMKVHDKSINTYSVNWVTEKGETQIKSIKESFCNLAPITPDIVSKFSNTIKFLEETSKV